MAQRQSLPTPRDPRPPRFGPVLVVVVYLVVSGVYILTSDWILALFVSEPHAMQRIQSFKGLAFVGVTGLMLYFLVRAAVRRAQAYQSRLEASSSELGHITATVPGIVLQARLDASGNWTFPYVSDPIESVFRLTRDQINADPMSMFRVIDPRDIDELNRLIERSRAELGAATLDFRITTSQGEHKWIRSQSVASREPDGSTLFHAVLIDVTEARRRDAMREGQSATLRMLIAGAPLGSVLESLASLAEAQAPDVRCTILLVDPATNSLSLGAAPSMDPGFAQALNGIPIGPDCGVCGAAAFHNRRVISEDTYSDPLCRSYADLARQYNLRACWSVPIAQQGEQVLGTLAFYHSAARRPTESDLRFAGQIADLAAVVIAQRQGETALRESERRYRQIVETAQEGVWLVDSQWRTTFVNEYMARMFGRPVEQLVGRAMSDLLGAAQHDQIRDHVLSRAERAGESLDLTIQRPDGTEISAIFTTNPIPDEQDRFSGALAMVTDITSRKRIEESLEESEERFRMLVSQSHVVIWQVDVPSTTFVYVSDFARSLLGYPVEAWYEPHFWINHVHPEDRQAVQQFSRRHTSAGKDHVFEYRMVGAGGKEVWVRDFVSVVCDGDRPARLLGAMVDITAEKRAQAELRESEERYRSIIEDQTELICRFLPGGSITFSNDAFDRFFDSGAHAAESRSVFSLLGESGSRALASTLRTLSPKRPVGQFQHRIAPDHREERTISWTCRALFEDSGQAVRYQAVGNDITELTEARDELLQTNQRQTLLLDELDHRVKNSLAGLLSLISLSEKEALGVEELASSIRARVQTMAATHSLLSASHWRSVELHALLQGLTPGETLGSVSFDGPSVNIPARQVTALGMIIQELMTNSVKYGGLSSDGGSVTIHWALDGAPDGRRILQLEWTERGGAPISGPIRPRLGVSLINGFARSELAGEARLSFPTEGATHHFLFRLDNHPRAEPDLIEGSEGVEASAGPQDLRA